VKPGETLVEARTDSDVQIDRQIYPVVEWRLLVGHTG
jgi:hypothetical protein